MKIEKLVGISRDRPKANNHLSQGFKFGEHFSGWFPIKHQELDQPKLWSHRVLHAGVYCITVEPQYNEVPLDWQNVFVITRIC